MKEMNLLIGLLILSVVAFQISVAAPADDDKKACILSSRAVLKIILKNRAPCFYKTVGKIENLDERKTKLGCITKCILKSEGILTEDNMVTEESLEASLEGNANVKLEYKERFYALYLGCLESFGSKIDPKDETCSGYTDMGECIQNSVMDMCHADIPL